MEKEKKISVGILAHVDSGKTTLSEAMLYKTGEIRSLGRVDNKDAFLDTDLMEKERGITIFSKQAVMRLNNTKITLIDTPGHVDFSAETERALWVMDYAVLVISGLDGVQSHTKTLWNLLKRHEIPTFLFINKMDAALLEKEELLKGIKEELSEKCVDFNGENTLEEIAVCDEKLTEKFFEDGINKEDIADAVFERKLFPCFFGSALKTNGVEELLCALENYTRFFEKKGAFSAKVFKIADDPKGNRMTFMKITGGQLCVRDKIAYGDEEEKVSEIRIYSGAKYKSVPTAQCGDVCAVCGLSKTYAGMGLGNEEDNIPQSLESVFTYKVIPTDSTDMRVAYHKLKKLEEEENLLHVTYNEYLSEIHIRLMGEVQLEIMQRILKERFSLNAEFERGSIVYKETIVSPAEGVGHYEPLRHYAEVHLLLEPLKRGSGTVFETDCAEDLLGRNWQRLILTHLKEKNHIGVLTGSPVTDIKITLKSGRAHLKHTEGGDFRQATYRAVRHGLRCAESILLEPYYSFRAVLPKENLGRALADFERMEASLNPPEFDGENAVIIGKAAVSAIDGYQKTLTGYTRGNGKMSVAFSGYDICKNAREVTEKIGYDPDRDTENTADSVFCKQGAGFLVPWNEVRDYMHLDSILAEKREERIPVAVKKKTSIVCDEDELMQIFERTYGKIVHKNHNAMRTPKDFAPQKKVRSSAQKIGPGYMLIDGYNIIFAWDELKNIAKDSLEDARNILIDRVCAYRALRPYEVILVFDAYRVKGNKGETESIHNIKVVYTKEAQTADAYIEKTAHELGKKYNVFVATSDALEQMIILGNGASRISAAAFIEEMKETQREISTIIKEISEKNA